MKSYLESDTVLNKYVPFVFWEEKGASTDVFKTWRSLVVKRRSLRHSVRNWAATDGSFVQQ